jgi:tRNA 2-thiouridine synthesizing protein A
MQIDARGLSCPLPVMRTKKALESAPSTLVVLVTSGTAKANVASLLRDEGFAVQVVEGDGEYRVEARRT